MPDKEPVSILLVEDNPGDVRLVQEGLRETGITCRVMVAADGEQAIDFLRRRGRFSSAATPQLVLLDLNLPKKSGHEVLRDIKGDPALSSIPIIVLSSSAAETDIEASYELQANCYIRKPSQLDEFFERLRCITQFWLNTASLPDSGGAGLPARGSGR